MNSYQKKYFNLYEKLGWNSVVLEYAEGRIDHQMRSILEVPFVSRGFPPALLPFMSDGSLLLYEGYWRHWCCGRKESIVTLWNSEVTEIARNFGQYASILVMNDIYAEDDLTENIKNFSNKIGVDNYEEINKLTIKGKQDPALLMKSTLFENNLPLEICDDSDKYNGSFPTEKTIESRLDLRNYCGYEMNFNFRSKLTDVDSVPAWLVKDSYQYHIFDEHWERGDIDACWMILNSPGWMRKQAINAMERLASKMSDELFDLLTDAWSCAYFDDSFGH